MKRLIYDLYYTDEITKEVEIKLLDKWSYGYNKRRSY